MLLMVKSRYRPIGVDQTKQFETTYLSRMISKIAYSVNFDFYEKKRTHEKT